jgi:signal transduction histidine kinase/ligand-binding sensor domain-containing protein
LLSEGHRIYARRVTCRRLAPIRILAVILLLGCDGTCEFLLAQPQVMGATVDLPVTNGLIRWWPNLFDARDEISGQEGVVMGVLPPVETGVEDETEFSQHTAWVHLQPAITNEVFTLSFWFLLRSAMHCSLLGQESGEREWCFQSIEDPNRFFIGALDFTPEDRLERVDLTLGRWHHVAIARRADGTSFVWVDGVRALDGRLPHPWPVNGRWLNVGNMLRTLDSQYSAMLRDLSAFDRVLTDSETRALHAAGLPRRPARNTTARFRATAQNVPMEVFTNVVVTTPQTWTHRRFTTEDGLPGNIVKAVLQARNGYLWVGTEAGLARFDGRQFRTFTTENTPALKAIGENVYSLSQDADGDIWAGLFGGLLRIRGLEFTGFTNGLPQRFVLQAEPAGDGSLWVAGFNSFLPRGPLWLRRYHPDSGTSSAEVVVPGHVRRIIAATNGVWLATEQPQMMLHWDGHAAAPTVVGTVGQEPPAVRLNNMAPKTDLCAWRSGLNGSNWWAEAKLGSDGPAFSWLWDTRLRRPWAARWNGPLADDQWLGVTHDLARLRGGLLEKIDVANGAAGPEISCLCANREGGVWFGTEEDGLHFVQERLIRVFTTQDGLGGNDVRTVCATSDGGLYLATAGGLCHYRNGEWSLLGQGKYRSVASDRQDRLWFADQGGGQNKLRRNNFDPARNIVSLGLEWQDPNTLRFAKDGTLWVVCERGLTWLQPGRLEETLDGNWAPKPANGKPAFGRYAIGKELPKIFPLGLVEDGDGSMWLGSLADGLFHVTNDRAENFSEKDGLPGNHCVPVYRDDSGALWIVTETGLTRRAGGRFQNVSEKDGLPKDVLLDLIEDDLGNFWVSGKRGIHGVARKELEEFLAGRLNRVRTLTLSVRDGLLTPECSSRHHPTMAKTPDGHIWVATRNGLATFDPRRVHLDTQPLPAVIEQLLVNRREIPLGHSMNDLSAKSAPSPRLGERVPEGRASRIPEAIQLPAGSGERLEFHYTAISLVAADRVKFRHRLDGYDSDWARETDLRLAFFTNLRPGTYQFRVKAANAHGVWNDRETTLSFVIQPYFWQTRAFYSAMGGAILALAAGLHRRRLSGQRRIQELKHQQAFTSEKERIAADMHDELGAALTQIAILGEVAKSQAGNHGQTGSTLDRISQAARDVTARMSELVWATNPRNDTLDNLVAYLREHAASQLESTAIQPRLEFPASFPEGRVSATFRRNLLLLLKESLNNLIKHAKATEASVKVEIAGSNLVLRIRDNGRGFEPAARNGTGNGLGNMQKRVRDLGGDFSLRSAPGQGTCIEISVPLNSQS